MFNSIFVGLATVSAILTKKYGVFSLTTILSLLVLYGALFLHMTLNPYYGHELYNVLFMIAPIVIVRVYYDIRLTYIMIAFILFASQFNFFSGIGKQSINLGLLYLLLSGIILIVKPMRSKSLHTFLLFTMSYFITIGAFIYMNKGLYEFTWTEIILWSLNVFILTIIASKIVPELLEYVEMTFSRKDLENDSLTNVHNRFSFNQQMDMLFLQERNGNIDHFAILFFDINKFKAINDQYGHLIGDHFLIQFAKFLTAELTDQEKLFRYGGDEFIIYTSRTGEDLIQFIRHVNENVQNKPFFIDQEQFIMNYSIGYAEFPVDSKNVQEIVKIADSRMYQMKHLEKSVPGTQTNMNV